MIYKRRSALETHMPDALIRGFFDEATFTVTHVVSCPVTKEAAIIDSVLDFDPTSGRTRTGSADAVLARVRKSGLKVRWHLETHAHADHLSAAPYMKQQLGGRTGIGARIREVQTVFKAIFNAKDMHTDGTPFDHLFEDGETLRLGTLEGRVMATPGHTPACVSYVFGADVFVGDTLFMPDYGSARCDFPGGDARTLYRSIRELLSLPPTTRLHLCHDYRPGGRAAQWQTTVAAQRAANIHLHDGVSEDEFVAMRTARDKTLAMPVLMLPAVQVNARAGEWPPPEDNGTRYLKIPLNAL
jgi:glyoxylase-like metal-dependent hydrolase (beta-lactamase superfamily II)